MRLNNILPNEVQGSPQTFGFDHKAIKGISFKGDKANLSIEQDSKSTAFSGTVCSYAFKPNRFEVNK